MLKKRKNWRASSWRGRLRRWLRLVYLKLVRTNDQPDKVAKGLGLGVFMGIFPTFGVGTIIAILIATWFKWNRASAALGTFIMNPLLNPFFLSLSVLLGNMLVPPEFKIGVEMFRNHAWWRAFLRTVPAYLAGNLLVSMLFSTAAYVLGYVVITKYRQRRLARQRAGKLAEALPSSPAQPEASKTDSD